MTCRRLITCQHYGCENKACNCGHNPSSGKYIFCIAHTDSTDEDVLPPSQETIAAAVASVDAFRLEYARRQEVADKCAHKWTEPETLKNYNVLCGKCGMVYRQQYRYLTELDKCKIGFCAGMYCP